MPIAIKAMEGNDLLTVTRSSHREACHLIGIS